jgi:hypothetical protein
VTRKNKDGTTVAHLQFAHDEQDPKAKYAKAKVMDSFGREDEVFKAMADGSIHDIDPALYDAIPEADNRISDPTTRDDQHF